MESQNNLNLTPVLEELHYCGSFNGLEYEIIVQLWYDKDFKDVTINFLGAEPLNKDEAIKMILDEFFFYFPEHENQD